MTDSVRCSSDSNHVFTCEVHIDSDPPPPGASSATASSTPPPSTPPATRTVTAAPPPADPVVSTLVARYTTLIPAVPAPYFTEASLTNCAGSVASIALALLGAKSTILGVITGVKTGYDTSKCFASEHNSAVSKATDEAAVAYCGSQGGVVTGSHGDTLICEVHEAAQ